MTDTTPAPSTEREPDLKEARASSGRQAAALREALQAVVDNAEADDNFEGEFTDYLVPFEFIDAACALLAADPDASTRPAGEPATDPGRLGARDADGKALWHNPRRNPSFDPNRPYEPDNDPFSTCAYCDQPWPCAMTRQNIKPVPVSGLWLRADPDGPIEVLAEVEGAWRVVISTSGEWISHIVEAQGIRLASPEAPR